MSLYELSLVLTGVVLLSAALSDLRSREVSDCHWWVILVMSSIIPWFVWGSGPYLQILAAVLAATSLIIGGGKLSVVCAMGVAPAWVVGLYFEGFGISCFTTAPLMVLAYYGFYRFGLIAGGADAKCLMSITSAFPTYLGSDTGILARVFPPSFSILFVSVILTVVIGTIWLIWKNRHDTLKNIPGYRISLDEAAHSFVWPLEDCRKRKVVRIRTPDYDEIPGILERLRMNGEVSVLVTPMFPFIVPIAIAFVLVAVSGCPLPVTL